MRSVFVFYWDLLFRYLWKYYMIISAMFVVKHLPMITNICTYTNIYYNIFEKLATDHP